MRPLLLLLGPLPVLALAFALAQPFGAEAPLAPTRASQPTRPAVRVSVAPTRVPSEGAPAFLTAFEGIGRAGLLLEAERREAQARHLAEERCRDLWSSPLAIPDQGPLPTSKDLWVLRRHGKRLHLQRTDHPVLFQLRDEAAALRAAAAASAQE